MAFWLGLLGLTCPSPPSDSGSIARKCRCSLNACHVVMARSVATSIPHISIIIPVWNDAKALARTLDHLGRLPGMDRAEVIVAAAGDRPGTELAVAERAQLLWPDGSTRAILLNAGAARAQSAVLFFLHADSFPPTHALELISQALADERVIGGAFEHLFAEPVWSLRVITWMNRFLYSPDGWISAAAAHGGSGFHPTSATHRVDGAHPGAAAYLRSPLPQPRPVAHLSIHRLATVVAHTAH
jgi:Glycosyl transferase family 2